MIEVCILAKYTDIKHAQIKRAQSATKNLNNEKGNQMGFKMIWIC